jgi:limonene-1,2-epoxide hydrolase
MTDMKQAAKNLVLAFGKAWEARDIETIIGMLAESVVHQNIPIPPMIGREAVRRLITPNLRAVQEMRWEFKAIEADDAGRLVLTERIDSFIYDSGRVDVPLMGIFEIEHGLISAWREYADIGKFVRDMQAIGRAPGPGITD